MTVSLVTWEGMRWLPGCLESLDTQTLEDFELLILDNGSTDDSVAWLTERAARDPRIRLTQSRVNLGFARAHDRHILEARGEAVLLLNQDVELGSGFLAAGVAVLHDRADVGSVQGRLRRLSAPGERTAILDTTGLVMHRDRRVTSRGQLELDEESSLWRTSGPLWGVDGAAPVYRLAALLGARLPRSDGDGWEILDEDFFAYKEDVDLAWRLRRFGWSAWYEPAALAWHARGSGDTGGASWRAIVRANMSNPPNVRALSWRNQRLMQIKNEQSGAFVRDLPWIARRELASWLFILVADPRRLAAVPGLLRAVPAAWRKRRAIRRAAMHGPTQTRQQARLVRVPVPSALRRTMEHVTRHGMRPTLVRIAGETFEIAREAVRRTFSTPVEPEVRSDAIRGRLERPRRGSVESTTTLLVAGWAYSSAGIEAVDVYLDRHPMAHASLDRARPDTAVEHGHLGDVRTSGYSAALRLPENLAPRRHDIHVVLRDRSGSVRVLSRSIRRVDPRSAYERWHERASAHDLNVVPRAHVAERAGAPAFHLVVTAQPGADLAATVRSIESQVCRRWRATIHVRPEDADAARRVIDRFAGSPGTGRWSITSGPRAILPPDAAPSRLVGFLASGEVLSPAALGLFVDHALDPGVSLLYSDHDSVDEEGSHLQPWFAPDWSPDRLLSQDYVGGVFMVRDGPVLRELLDDVAGQGDVAWRYDLLLRLGERVARIRHIPRILWSRPEGDDPARADAELALVRRALTRRAGQADVRTSRNGAGGPIRQIMWPLGRSARVSVIVPTTGRPDLVATILETLERTDYALREVIFIDNSRGRHPDGVAMLHESAATVIEIDEPFNFARLCNAGARSAGGELLLFLNDDVVATEPGWLDELVRQGQRPGIGAVGCLLLFPDGTIQHAGVVVTRYGGGAAHLFEGLDPNADLYLDLQHLTREVSAVTGACLMVPRAVFDDIGGFDEKLAVSGNDVDLCLRIASTGRRVLWTPHTRLVHNASTSRAGVSHLADEGRLRERWASVLGSGDPYSNPNLAQDRADCAVDPATARGLPVGGYRR